MTVLPNVGTYALTKKVELESTDQLQFTVTVSAWPSYVLLIKLPLCCFDSERVKLIFSEFCNILTVPVL